RDQILLCMNFGGVRDGKTGELLSVCGEPEYVRETCEKSLKRLGVETIDLYYQHRVDKDTSIEETVKAMAELVKEGKVRYLGLSGCSAKTLRRAHKIHPISPVQVNKKQQHILNTYRGVATNGVLQTARELGISIVGCSPLGRAMFTDATKPANQFGENVDRRYLPRFAAEHFDKNKELADKMKVLATKKGLSLSECVLAWILAQNPEFIVFPGTKRITYLESRQR
ncbi:NADP-dependent oxidoreductase domain-containing protein, partial [Zychaea mexicana]|uniref:NADP-dependent oxidoreductase domain-containing protein n=1 Tax=Zychaea mexicana TaxID=64656 RepID=UPI0022FDDDFF